MPRQTKNAIWVYIDLRNDRFFGFSLNVLAKARELAQAVGGTATAIIAGAADKQGDERGDIPGDAAGIVMGQAAKEVISYGADEVIVIENQELGLPRADLFASGLVEAVRQRSPRIVLFAMSDFGRELAARTACLTHNGLIADCAVLTVEDEKIVATCPSWGGEIMARIVFADEKKTGFATVQPTIAKAVKERGKPGNLETIRIDAINAPAGLRLVSRRYEGQGQRRLEDAEVVVVGGAGVGSADGFGRVREFAAALGGEVGATRPPVLQHWVEEKRLIGQTGKTVRPKLLFRRDR